MNTFNLSAYEVEALTKEEALEIEGGGFLAALFLGYLVGALLAYLL